MSDSLFFSQIVPHIAYNLCVSLKRKEKLNWFLSEKEFNILSKKMFSMLIAFWKKMFWNEDEELSNNFSTTNTRTALNSQQERFHLKIKNKEKWRWSERKGNAHWLSAKKRMSQFFCDRPKCDAIFLRQSNSTFVLRLLRPMLVRHKDKNATLVRKSLRH